MIRLGRNSSKAGGYTREKAHNFGGSWCNSPYTSWTRDPNIAKSYAQQGEGPDGVVLRAPKGKPGPDDDWAWEFSDDIFMESEVLLKGRREGLDVLSPEEL